jgi:hypothetical protein
MERKFDQGLFVNAYLYLEYDVISVGWSGFQN